MALATRISVLGEPAVITDEGLAVIGSARQARLLVGLALAAGGLTHDQLTERMWDDSERPDDPTASIRTYVNRLRAQIGDPDGEVLVTRTGGYAIDFDRVSVDAHEFESLIAREAGILDASERRDLLVSALSLWRGPALGSLSDLMWAVPDAVRLEELRMATEENLLRAKLDLGEHVEVVARAEQLLEEHPYRESLREAQIVALYRSDRQVDALRAFEEHRTRLVEELGVDASPNLRRLEHLILTQDASLDAVGGMGRPLRGYRLQEMIGSGAVSQVYRGVQPGVGRDVAIKVIRSELANRPKFISRFQAEAQTVARLEHHHIVPLYDYWREPERAYLVMRLLPSNLGDAIAERRLDPPQVTEMVLQIAAALDFAHQSGVVHRDVKPRNILLDRDGNAFLSDFGIAADELVALEREAGISSSSEEYRAPEHARGTPATPASDIYALGLVSREALVAGGSLDPTTERVIAEATADDPAARPGSALEFAVALKQAITGEPLTPPTRPRVGDNPYRGLMPFGEADAAVFFGRERLVNELRDRLRVQRTDPAFVTVVGASGTGKSSLVLAGLVPAVRDDGCLVTVMRPGPDPLTSLVAALEAVATSSGSGIEALIRNSPTGLRDGLDAVVADDHGLLLVVDQLEEIYTLCDDEAGRNRFLDLLADAVMNSSHLKVVATLRADSFDRPLEHGAFADAFSDSVLTIAPMSAPELESAIVAPAREAGVELEPGLVGSLHSDAISRPGALPLLQFTLTELFSNRQENTLTMDSYRRIGGLAGALRDRAEALYEELDDDSRNGFHVMLGRLVEVGEQSPFSRRSVPRAELVRIPGVDDDLVDRMGSMRLLGFDHHPKTREPVVEISHEALITEWPRLTEWIAERRGQLVLRRRLESARREWTGSGRSDDYLLAGDRLGTFRSLEGTDVLAGPDAEYLRLSAEAEASRSQARRRRRILIAGSVGVAIVVALALGVLAILARQEADQRRIASAQAQLVNRVLYEADRRTDVSLLLAAEAYRRDPGPASSAALLDVLSGERRPATAYTEAEHTGPPKEASCFSSVPERGVFVSAGGGIFGSDAELVVFDVTEEAVQVRMEVPFSCGAEALPDGSFLGTASEQGLALGRPVIVGRDGGVTSFDPDVRRVFAPLTDGRLFGELTPAEGEATGLLVQLDPASGAVLEETGVASLELVVDPTEGRAVTQTLGPSPDGDPAEGAVGRGILDLDTYELVPLDETGEAFYFWAPDGEELFSLADRELVRISARSGEIVDRQFVALEGTLINSNGQDIDSGATHIENVTPAFPPSFSPDGSVVAFTTEAGVERFSYPGFAPIGSPIVVDGPVSAVSMLTEATMAIQELSGTVSVVDAEGSPPLEKRTRFPGAQFLESTRYGSTFEGVLVDLETGQEVDPYERLGLGHDVGLAPVGGDRWLVFSSDGVSVLDDSGSEVMATVAFPENARSETAYLRTGEWARLLDATEFEEGDPPTKVIVDSINVVDGTLIRTPEIDVEGWQRPPLAGEGGFWAQLPEHRFEVIDWAGERLATLSGSLDHGSAISPDGQLMALVREDRTVTVVDLTTGEPVAELLAASHYEPPVFVGAELLVIRDEDGRVELWDVRRGVSLGTLASAPDWPPIGPFEGGTGGYDPLFDEGTNSLWFSQEGRFVNLPLDPEVWIGVACATAGRSLTEEEWSDLIPFDESYRNACDL